MELEQEYNERKDTPLANNGRVQHQQPYKGVDLVGVIGKAWRLFNIAALRVFLMIGLVLMIQIIHQAHGQLLITIPISFVALSVLLGELVNLYNEIDVILYNEIDVMRLEKELK